MLFQCSVCTTSFTLKKNLYVHMRRKHQVEPEMDGKIVCPLLCGGKFRTHSTLRAHLNDRHQQECENEQHHFQDAQTFELWKKQLEESSGYSYVRRISEKRLQGGEAKTYYICHRSGMYRSINEDEEEDEQGAVASRKRRRRGAGSAKMGATCPSVMEVSRFPADDTVRVVFWKSHFGHGADARRVPQRNYSSVKRRREVLPLEVCAVLPAAGTGQRMGPGTPKQYVPIHQKPLICYTVEAFLRLPFIKKVVVVASPASLDLMLGTLSGMCALEGDKLMVTEGADNRHESIRSGLKALETCCEVQPEVVVIHDGVRPFFSEDVVFNVVRAAKEHGAAGVTCPLVSTVISVDAEGFLDSSLDRNKYRASEMPQAFNYDLICKAYDKSTAHDLEFGTECLHLIQKYMGIKAKLLPGTSHLWKVTHHKDIYTAAAVVKESQKVGIICSNSHSSLSSALEKCLSQTFESVHLVGKLKERALGRFPNIVHVHDLPDPYPAIERLSSLPSRQPRLTQLATLAHVFARPLHPTLNFLELQKQAKECAKRLRDANILVYFIVGSESTESFEELAELVRSLLFDSNPNISGSVFLS